MTNDEFQMATPRTGSVKPVYFTIRDLRKIACCRHLVGRTDGIPLCVFCRRDAGSTLADVSVCHLSFVIL